LDFEALLIKPKDAQEGVKLPLVVIPHGGSTSVGGISSFEAPGNVLILFNPCIVFWFLGSLLNIQ
jgi:dipeptidyl aminopeptidase/acylaminoacyl peptidase